MYILEFPIRIIRVRLFRTFSTNRGSIIFSNNRNNRDDYSDHYLGAVNLIKSIVIPESIFID